MEWNVSRTNRYLKHSLPLSLLPSLSLTSSGCRAIFRSVVNECAASFFPHSRPEVLPPIKGAPRGAADAGGLGTARPGGRGGSSSTTTMASIEGEGGDSRRGDERAGGDEGRNDNDGV